MENWSKYLKDSVFIGIAVSALGLAVETFVHELQGVVLFGVLVTIALIAIITAVICRIRFEITVGEISKRIEKEITGITRNVLQNEIEAARKLTGAADRAAAVLEATNNNSSLSRILLTKGATREIEKLVRKEIYIVTRDLRFDEEISDIVEFNIRRGIKYVYIMPESASFNDAVENFLDKVRLDAESNWNINFVAIPLLEFHFPQDLVVYDPRRPESRNGYLRLPINGESEVRAIHMSESLELRALSESLTGLIARHNRAADQNKLPAAGGGRDDPRNRR